MTRLVLVLTFFGFCSTAFAAEKPPDAGKPGKRGDKSGEKRGGRGLAAHYYADPVEWDGDWTPGSKPQVDPKDWTFTAYDRTCIEPLVNRLFVGRGWFSVRWKGRLTVPEKGAGPGATEVAFEVWADDGCRLYIDGVKLIDDWQATWEKDPRSHRVAQANLAAGGHRIVLEYFQGESLRNRDRDPMKLYWSCPARGIPRQIVPASAFSHEPEDLVPEPGRLDPQGEELPEGGRR